MEDLEIKVNGQAGQIECDFETVKKYLEDVLAEYKVATYCDESIPAAKANIATLRKQQKAFQDQVKKVKNAYMAPFDEFKAKADELIRLYDEPIGFIDGQIKDYETRRIQAKRERIGELYTEIFGELADLIPIEKIYNARWDNKTFIFDDIKEEILQQATKINNELQIIEFTNSGFKEKAKELYISNLDLTATMQRIHEYEDARQAEIERQQKEEIDRKVREALEAERAKQQAEAEKEAAVKEAAETALDAYIPEESGAPAKEYFYQITLTPEQKESLEMYMNSVGIEYAEV